MLTSVAVGFVSAISAGRSWPAAFQRMSSRFAADSPLEESGFEPSVPPCERVGLRGRNANASQATIQGNDKDRVVTAD